MRLFVSIQPDAAVRAWFAASQERLGKALRRFSRELRWVDLASMHLTLAFLGEVDDAAPMVQQLERCHCLPMDLTVEGLGVFPNPRRPSVLWAGVVDRTGRLAALQADVATALAPFVEPECRPFEPHLTLARIKRGPHSHLGAAIAALAGGWDSAPVSWHVDHFCLMESRLGSGGAQYSVVRVFGCSG